MFTACVSKDTLKERRKLDRYIVVVLVYFFFRKVSGVVLVSNLLLLWRRATTAPSTSATATSAVLVFTVVANIGDIGDGLFSDFNRRYATAVRVALGTFLIETRVKVR